MSTKPNPNVKKLYLAVKQKFAERILQLEQDLPKIKALIEILPESYSAEDCAKKLEDLKEVFRLLATYDLHRDTREYSELIIQARDASKLEGPFDWRELIQEGDLSGRQSMDLYQAKRNWAAKQCPGISLDGGIFLHTGENVVRVAVSHNSDNVRILRMATFLAQNVISNTKPLADGFVQISLFENSLSEHGSFCIKVHPDQDLARLVRCRYGRESDITQGTLQEVLKYCSLNHYYGDTEDE